MRNSNCSKTKWRGFLFVIFVLLFSEAGLSTVFLVELHQKIAKLDWSCKTDLAFVLNNLIPIVDSDIRDFEKFLQITGHKTPAEKIKAMHQLLLINKILKDRRTLIFTDFDEDILQGIALRVYQIVRSWQVHEARNTYYWHDFDFDENFDSIDKV